MKRLVLPWRQAIDAWILRRLRRQTGEVEIGRRRVYILPTRFGWGFALMAFVMLLGATNYANSMAFALCFLLTALGLVSMHHTHANLVSLRVHAGPAEPAFPDAAVDFKIIIDNPTARHRYDLQSGWRKQQATSQGDVPASGSLMMSLPLAALSRGYLRAPAFRLTTEFPLGLFQAWTWIELDMDAWVYPRPIDSGATTLSDGVGQAQAERMTPGNEDFMGLRPYRIGDPLGRVHWKRFASDPVPQVKQFGQTLAPQQWLDWRALPQLDSEARLSQLAWWALQAHEERAAFGLRLPGREIAMNQGEDHLRRCLLELAMFRADPA